MGILGHTAHNQLLYSLLSMLYAHHGLVPYMAGIHLVYAVRVEPVRDVG